MPAVVSLDESFSVNTLLYPGNGYRFNIRAPQRRFKWEAQQIKQFWEDITKALDDEDRDEHFLGPILLVKENSPGGVTNYSVIDGQQRLTTLGLCLAILRDECIDCESEADFVLDIHHLLVRRVLSEYQGTVLTPQDPDAANYEKCVKEQGSTNPLFQKRELPNGGGTKYSLTSGSSENPDSDLVLPALVILKQLISDYLPQGSERKPRLEEIVRFIFMKVTLLAIDVLSEDQGYMIFDTANTRGKKLSQSEKIRAGLALHLRTDPNLRTTFSDNWMHAGRSLESKKLPIDAMDRYMHVIWSAHKGYQPINNLSNNIIETLSKPNANPTPTKFIANVRDFEKSYGTIVKPELSDISVAGLKADLLDLRRLKFTQANGFLTMVHKHQPELLARAVNAALTLQIRNITIGPGQPHDYQEKWPAWSGLALDSNTERAIAEIQEGLAKDEDFKKSFLLKSDLDPAAMYHVLRKLDEAKHPNSGSPWEGCEVEHIVPSSVLTQLINAKPQLHTNVRRWIEDLGYDVPTSDTAKKRLGSQIKDFVGQAGNQVLWHHIPNRAIGNDRFSAKRGSYLQMAVLSTQDVGQQTEWSLNDVAERQQELAELALVAWPSAC